MGDGGRRPGDAALFTASGRLVYSSMHNRVATVVRECGQCLPAANRIVHRDGVASGYATAQQSFRQFERGLPIG